MGHRGACRTRVSHRLQCHLRVSPPRPWRSASAAGKAELRAGMGAVPYPAGKVRLDTAHSICAERTVRPPPHARPGAAAEDKHTEPVLRSTPARAAPRGHLAALPRHCTTALRCGHPPSRAVVCPELFAQHPRPTGPAAPAAPPPSYVTCLPLLGPSAPQPPALVHAHAKCRPPPRARYTQHALRLRCPPARCGSSSQHRAPPAHTMHMITETQCMSTDTTQTHTHTHTS